MPTPAPLFVPPLLLGRAPSPPSGDAWLHEIKYDGYRLLARVDAGRVALFSRPGADWTSRLPAISNAVAGVAESVYLDGELVYLTPDGMPDFDALRKATQWRRASGPLYYQVFDLLRLGQRDLASRPLSERKALLADLLKRANNPRLRYVAHVVGNGDDFFNAADSLGLEGIVSKRSTSVYHPGERSRDWLKVKCFRTHRFQVVGFTTEARPDGHSLASLALAGQTCAGDSVYAGRVEFGVPGKDRTLLSALQSMIVTAAPTAVAPTSRSITWVAPRLTAEVRCLRWEPGRAIRHGVLRGLAITP
jgi:bifunctional non-homologous end joining protein LigD